MPLPVLFLIQHLDIGGTEHHVLDLLTGLDRARFAPHLIHFNNPEGKVSKLIEALPGVTKSYWPVSRAYAPSGLLAARRVRQYLRRHEIRAVVTFHFVADFIGTLGALGGPPVISSRRDMGFTRTSRQFRAGRMMSRFVERYIAVSEAVREAIARDEGVDPARIEVIYNGVDLEALGRTPWNRAAERARLGIAPDTIVIACVANFNPVKRHEDLIAAFAQVRAQCPKQQLVLLLAGAGPLEAQVKAMIAGAGLTLGADAFMVGQSADVTREFLMADIVALASETEGFSNSIVQAMALEKPVVACRVGGNPEAIADGETGLLVPPCNVLALTAALARLVEDAGMRATMGRHGVARAQKMFSREAMLARTMKLLESVADSKA